MRDFTFCRQEVAEDCWFEEEHVHVVITTPGYREIIPRCGRPKLQLFFYDLDPSTVERNGRGLDQEKLKSILEGCFTEAQAWEIARFVQNTPEEKTVVVNCEAGCSRSPAVVLAFRRFYGGDVNEPFEKGFPNMHVTSVLSGVLREINK